jgi:VanZ family protein
MIIALIKNNWRFLALLTLICIAILSLLPAENLPKVRGVDKTHHFLAYVALAFPVALRQAKHWQLILVGFFMFSGLIELIQPYVNRQGEWLDLLANALGLFTGAIIAYFLNSQFKKFKALRR